MMPFPTFLIQYLQLHPFPNRAKYDAPVEMALLYQLCVDHQQEVTYKTRFFRLSIPRLFHPFSVGRSQSSVGSTQYSYLEIKEKDFNEENETGKINLNEYGVCSLMLRDKEAQDFLKKALDSRYVNQCQFKVQEKTETPSSIQKKLICMTEELEAWKFSFEKAWLDHHLESRSVQRKQAHL